MPRFLGTSHPGGLEDGTALRRHVPLWLKCRLSGVPLGIFDGSLPSFFSPPTTPSYGFNADHFAGRSCVWVFAPPINSRVVLFKILIRTFSRAVEFLCLSCLVLAFQQFLSLKLRVPFRDRLVLRVFSKAFPTHFIRFGRDPDDFSREVFSSSASPSLFPFQIETTH